MRTGTIFKRYELFVAAAVIAAHASGGSDGFRQRNVRFLIELFSNWVETTFEGRVLSIGNTQVQRYLDDLIADGFARGMEREGRPRYRLTRSGILELLGRLTPRERHIQPEHFFFLYYFVVNYRPRIQALVASEGRQFSQAMNLELEALLDSKALLENQLSFAEAELIRLDKRMSQSLQAGILAAKLFGSNVPLLDVAEEIQKHHPYELNSQKPLKELIAEIPEDIGSWELQTGNMMRVEQIWEPSRAMLVCYIDCLKKMIKPGSI